jgi:hypothetical protein
VAHHFLRSGNIATLPNPMRPPTRILTVLFAAFLSFTASAAEHVWTGAVSDRVSDPVNWLGGAPSGDPDATLVFSPSGSRAVVNDVPGLEVTQLMFAGTDYVVSGQRIRVRSAIRDFSKATVPLVARGATIRCDVELAGVLRVESSLPLKLDGSVSGTGELVLVGSITLAGTEANRFAGRTTVESGSIVLAKKEAVAVPGQLTIVSGTVTIEEPEQIADASTVICNGELTGTKPDTISILQGAGKVAAALIVLKEVQTKGTFSFNAGGSPFRIRGEGFTITLGANSAAKQITIEGRGNLASQAACDLELLSGDVAFDAPKARLTLRDGIARGALGELDAIQGWMALKSVAGAARIRKDAMFVSLPMTVGGKLTLESPHFAPGSDMPWTTGATEIVRASAIEGTFAEGGDGAVLDGKIPVRLSFSPTVISARAIDRARTSIGGGFYPGAVNRAAGTISVAVQVSSSVGPISTFPVTGTIRYFDGNVEIGSTLVGKTFPFTAPSMGYPIRVEYSGDQNYLPCSKEILTFSYADVTFASVTPAVVEAGTLAHVTLRGTNFYPGMGIRSESPTLKILNQEFVSPTELTVWFRTTRGLAGKTAAITTTDAPKPRLPITFTGPGIKALERNGEYVTAKVTPKGTVLWAYARTEQCYGATTVVDTDGDGVVTYNTACEFPWINFWLAVDLTTADYAAVEGSYVESPFPHDVFIHDRAGHITSFNGGRGLFATIIVVRPGVGAWYTTHVDSDDPLRPFALFHAMVASSPPLTNLEPQDLVLTIDSPRRGNRFAAARVSELLDPGFGPRFTLSGGFREGGPSQASFVRANAIGQRATLEWTARPAVTNGTSDFSPTSGTVTLEPGQVSGTLPIEIGANDDTYGFNKYIEVTWRPVGSATFVTQDVGVGDDEPLPVLTMTKKAATYPEGDSNTLHQVELILTGKRRHTVRVDNLFFAPDETRKFVTVAVGDDVFGPDRTVSYRPTICEGCYVASSSQEFTLINDDPPIVWLTGGMVIKEGDTASIGAGTLGYVGAKLTVRTVEGTATSADFTPVPATPIVAGVVGVSIPTLRDNIDEPIEVFYVEIVTSEGSLISNQRTAVYIVDPESDPVVSLPATAIMHEGGDETLSITLDRPLTAAASVGYAVQTPGGCNGASYGMSGTLNLPVGTRSAPLPLKCLADNLVSGNREMIIYLYSPKNLRLGNATCTVTIIEPVVIPNIVIKTFDITEDNHSPGIVSCNPCPNSLLTLKWTITEGTAVSPFDFTALSGTVTVDPLIAKVIPRLEIWPPASDEVEGDETFTLHFEPAGSYTSYTLSETTFPMKILARTTTKPRSKPRVWIEDVSVPENHGGVVVVPVKVKLSVTPLETLSLGWSAVSLTAGSGDFMPSAGTVTFAPNTAIATIPITILPDSTREATETFRITLSPDPRVTVTHEGTVSILDGGRRRAARP